MAGRHRHLTIKLSARPDWLGMGLSGWVVAWANVLCSELLAAVQQKTREGYEEALRLAAQVLEMEPGNRMVHEYQALIGMFLREMDDRVEQDVVESERHAQDPNRTPSEVSSESEEAESGGDDDAEDADAVVSEVETDEEGASPQRPV